VQGQIDASGETSIPDKKARGTITFTNLTDHSLTIPGGSIVISMTAEELRFATTQEVILPGGAGQTADVVVLAMEGGSVGNIDAGSVIALEGSLGPDVVVTNPAAFMGGSDQVLPAVTHSDYEKLRAQLLETLKDNAINDLETSLSSEVYLLADTLILSQIEEENSLPDVGSPGDTLVLNMRAEFSALVVSNQDLRDLAMAALDANLPENQRAVTASLQVTTESKPVRLSNQRVEWTVTATRNFIPDIQREVLLKAVLGKRIEVAIQNLNALMELQKPVEIALSPGWWFWMPSLGFRIQFEVQ
jgi:hypothetical protein